MASLRLLGRSASARVQDISKQVVNTSKHVALLLLLFFSLYLILSLSLYLARANNWPTPPAIGSLRGQRPSAQITPLHIEHRRGTSTVVSLTHSLSLSLCRLLFVFSRSRGGQALLFTRRARLISKRPARAIPFLVMVSNLEPEEVGGRVHTYQDLARKSDLNFIVCGGSHTARNWRGASTPTQRRRRGY